MSWGLDSELAHHHFHYILRVKASHRAALESPGGKRASTSGWVAELPHKGHWYKERCWSVGVVAISHTPEETLLSTIRTASLSQVKSMFQLTDSLLEPHLWWPQRPIFTILPTIAFPQVNGINFLFSSLLSSKICLIFWKTEKEMLEKERWLYVLDTFESWKVHHIWE